MPFPLTNISLNKTKTLHNKYLFTAATTSVLDVQTFHHKENEYNSSVERERKRVREFSHPGREFAKNVICMKRRVGEIIVLA